MPIMRMFFISLRCMFSVLTEDLANKFKLIANTVESGELRGSDNMICTLLNQIHSRSNLLLYLTIRAKSTAGCGHCRTKAAPLLLPPANEVCKGYVFTPVCQSFCSQGGVPAPLHAGIHSLGRYPPGGYPPAGTPLRQVPFLGRYTPLCAVYAGIQNLECNLVTHAH